MKYTIIVKSDSGVTVMREDVTSLGEKHREDLRWELVRRGYNVKIEEAEEGGAR